MRINIWNAHVPEAELAVYKVEGGKPWLSPWVWYHVSRCERCQNRAREYAEDQEYVRYAAGVLPTGVNWELLSSEMAANIRVGLAAGECVSPRAQRHGFSFRSSFRSSFHGMGDSWRVAAACAGFAVLMASAWWLNTPEPRTESLSRAVSAIAGHSLSRTETGATQPAQSWLGRTFHSAWFGNPGGAGLLRWDEARSEVRVSSQGIELRENGSSLGITGMGVSPEDAHPVAVTLSVQGAARANYLDADTGQITIASVYAQ